MNRKTIYITKETHTQEDQYGNITSDMTEKSTEAIFVPDEPDYIKLYTRIWCEANSIPNRWRGLFLEIAMRMTYCNANDLQKAQLFVTSKLIQEDICKCLGWNAKDGGTYKKGLSELCNCKALRHVCRATYQVNPEYAGRGEWRYNPHLQRGGVQELVTTFRMNARGVSTDTQIVWAGVNNGGFYGNELDQMYAKGMGLNIGGTGIIKHKTEKNEKNAEN